MAVNLDTLHDWLLAATRGVGPQTTVELMADLDTLRSVNPGPYSDLPADGITMQQCLSRLAIQGRAVCEKGRWQWCQPAPKADPQRSLFE